MSIRNRETSNLIVLVTGFSGFPGARANPTEILAKHLASRQMHFLRKGIRLETRILPVVYASIAGELARHVDLLSPDIILHFGLATRRRHFCVETHARNRQTQIHPDAAGRRAQRAVILSGGEPIEKARIPAAEILAALRRAGFPCRLSNNAGDYLCNAALYLSLAAAKTRRVGAFQAGACQIGFIHVPPLAKPRRSKSDGRPNSKPTLVQLSRAAELALLAAARVARVKRRGDRVKLSKSILSELNPLAAAPISS